jgi:hypothetical protein
MDSVTALAEFHARNKANALKLEDGQEEQQTFSMAGAAMVWNGLAGPEALKQQPVVFCPKAAAHTTGNQAPMRVDYNGRVIGYLILSSELIAQMNA